MLYKPNYCSHCGEQNERIEWKLWTSRRFCENCEGAFRKEDWMPKIGAFLAVLIGLFGFGSYLKTPERPLNMSTNQFVSSFSNKAQNEKNEQVTKTANVNNSPLNQNSQANTGLQNQTKVEAVREISGKQTLSENRQNEVNEPVYFCGAQTKKGTPCTRKVKGGGRCWQHTGLPAMLPKEKLVSSQ